MSVETVREEHDVTVYRCDTAEGAERCTRQTASFQTVDSVTVLLDPAWVQMRVGLDEERHFCSWAHFTSWVTQEDTGGTLAARLRTAAETRDHRDQETAAHVERRTMQQRRAAMLLGLVEGV